MNAKFSYSGAGAKIPGTDFGLSAGFFKLWVQPTGGDWKGYTTASNQGLLGAASITTPVVQITMRDLEDEEPFSELHASSTEVTITPTTFASDGGTATIDIKRKSNDSVPEAELSFFSDECTGFSASAGDIHFTATLVQLPQEEWDPSSAN